MSLIEANDFVIAVPDGIFLPVRARLPVDQVLRDAAADVEEGVAFWKTLVGSRQPKRRASLEFLNRSG